MKLKMLVFLAFSLLLFSCKKEKECPDCGEHGICNESTKTCDCETGYNGSKCQFEKTPTGMRITGVRLKQYPPLNNGVAWDNFSSYADPYFIVFDVNGNQIFKSGYFEEVQPSTPVSWATTITVNPIAFSKITFYDYDSGSTDSQMESIFFTPYQSGSNFPTVKTFQQGSLIVDIYYSYQF